MRVFGVSHSMVTQMHNQIREWRPGSKTMPPPVCFIGKPQETMIEQRYLTVRPDPGGIHCGERESLRLWVILTILAHLR